MPLDKRNLIWIDLEMTGLDIERNRIIEIATLITDINLNILAEGPVFAIYQSDEHLELMDQWNKYIHTFSGLIDKVKQSKLDEDAAATLILEFLKKWVPPGKSPICGNNVGHDRNFLSRYMPKLESYFHYRCLDVSTLKELVYRWKPEILIGLKKNNTHQSLNDIRESVMELSYYRKYFINL